MANKKVSNIVENESEKRVAPYVSEVSGYITVRQAAELATNKSGKERLQSTINYWLREGEFKAVYLDDSVLLIDKSSLVEFLDNKLPQAEAERARIKEQKELLEAEEAKLKEEMDRRKAELKAMREALKKR